MARTAASQLPAGPELERPRLELSGRKLTNAFERLVDGTEDHGGIERHVDALKLKSEVFQHALGEGRETTLEEFKVLCALMPSVRRRIGAHLANPQFQAMRASIAGLLVGIADTRQTDARVTAFCASFPDDRAHRWVRDLAAEILHYVDPERYPLMSRWVWDARTNTGALREIWHAEDIDRIVIDIPDRYGTFVMLREELSQFLTQNGVFRDVMQYVDLLTAQIYGDYVSEQGSDYLRASFNTPSDPLQYTRRLLGLDGVDAKGRTRLKAADGKAVVIEDLKLANQIEPPNAHP
ncbi:MAG: hypothetical protein ACKVQU_15180 [Burkholderiales bacterium]